MLMTDFYSEFAGSIDQGDLMGANNALMKELGNILVRNRKDFIDLLNEAGIAATANMTDVRLVDLFMQNVGKNRKLTLGASLLVNMHNKQMGFDGEQELNDDAVKSGYAIMRTCLANDGETAEDFANAGGAVLSSISDIIKSGGQIAGKAMEGQQKKKYGALDIATQREQAKAAMTQAVLAERQAQIEAARKKQEQRSKTNRTLLIVGGLVLTAAVIGTVIYLIKKRKK